MPGDDDVVILGHPNLKLLGYDSLGARVQERAALTEVDTAAYWQCRRVIITVDCGQWSTRECVVLVVRHDS